MRKALTVAICALAFVILAIPAFASDPVDNVFTVGLDIGYYGPMGWIGENFDGGPGFGLYFGYGITEYFSMQLDYMPMIMTSPSGDDVKNMDTAVWGGYSNGGFGGVGITGKLFPRKVYREADFKVVQPFIFLGAKYVSFIYEYKTATLEGDEYDGINNIILDFGVGVDFYITDFVSLGPSVGIHKPFLMGDTIQGQTVDSDFKSDWEGSMLWNASLGLKFQW